MRWAVAGRMVAAWLITLPAAAVVGALMWFAGDLIGGLAGALVVFAVLVALAVHMYLRSRRQPIGHNNVNDEWDAPAAAPRVTAGAAS
ncbi:hypothetical protein Asi03nite_18120 [Actinoplanes siamensis]|uniref:Uncharacterized protein n=1 Tax=Actinoplanes siamensis TaxID=1223317 RepID=A0A919N4Q3_9ACTN|nr:hypothetical protein Asi03nite_18120 [Actinoplanes siamensis]